MNIPTGKIEKAVSKSKYSTQPALECVNLTTDPDGSRWLEATDSYKLVRIPAGDVNGDVDGMIPASVFAEARKVRNNAIMSHESEVNYLTKTGNGSTRKVEGTFPNCRSLIPDTLSEFCITLNARLLLDIAEALGSPNNTVTLRFCEGTDSKPANMRPIVIDSPSAEGKAVLMPVRRSQ